VRLDALTPEAVHERGQLSFGQPRAIRVAVDGRRVALLRSPDPLSPEQGLWLLERDGDGGWAEQRVDASARATGSAESAAAAAMRERMRELAAGIVEYSADADLQVLVFNAGGCLWRFMPADGALVRLEGTDGAEAPLLSPDGRLLAFLTGGSLRVVRTDQPATVVAAIAPEGEHETLGRPDFIAAEELGRFVGMWWDPSSHRLLFQRTDDSPVPEWTIDQPGDPAAEPKRVRYPVANGANAVLALAVLDVRTGTVIALAWDRERFPYLCRATWSEPRGLTIDVQTRDQRTVATLAADVDAGTTAPLATLEDPEWVEVGNGTREHGPGGELCRLLDADGARVVAIGDRIGCAGALGIDASCAAGLLVAVAPTPVDRRIALMAWDGRVRWLSDEPGVARAWAGGDIVVIEQRGLEGARPETRILGIDGASERPAFSVTTHAEPLEWPEPVEVFAELADGGSSAALLLPSGYDAGRDGPLPVLLDPYGGPHHARVTRDRRAYVHARWLAEHGYAVLAIDGVGTPGRSPAWEHAIARAFTRTLDSQIDGLRDVAERRPGVLDLGAVGIRGWSFGGWLSALAAIREPELFRAAAVGAPVSDWALYDTHYTERYLGLGEAFTAAAERNSLAGAVEAAVAAGRTPSAMLIMHGFEDDNVVVAHSIRLAESLTLHGIPHASILLPSLTHIGRTPALAKLQRLELAFFDRELRRS
jgi:dipeptidyl-peptidase-4